MNDAIYSDKVIYVVAGQYQGAINDRVKKLLTLRSFFSKLVLVTPGDNNKGEQSLELRPLVNPTGLLRLIKLNKLKKSIDKQLYFPSTKILYAKSVERALGQRIAEDLNQGKSVILLTCAPPHDLCLAGLKLKRKYPNIRWLVDWQDLWSYDESYINRIPARHRKRLLEIEKNVFDECDLNITTNSYASDVLNNKYGVPVNRVTHIPHHFSYGDMPVKRGSHLKDDKNKHIVKIGYLGGLFKPPKVPGMKVVKMIRDLRDGGQNVELHIHGPVSSEVDRIFKQKGFDGVFFHGSTEHADSLRLIMGYDLLLLVLADLPNCKAIMNIKLPHYLVTGIPIVAIVPDFSILADIIRETGAGYVIPSGEGWIEPVKNILENYQQNSGLPMRKDEAIDVYSWENISGIWLKVLNGNHVIAET